MFTVSLWGLTIVALISVTAPVVVHFIHRVWIPAVAVEIILGIVVGPSGFGWVKVTVPISVLAYFGLGFLFFVAGLEIDVKRLTGPLLRLAGGAFIVSLVLAFAAGYTLWAIGLVGAPVFVAIILASTSLGIVTGVIKDVGLGNTDYGQLALSCASMAEFGTVMILSLFLTSTTKSPSARIVLVACFVAFLLVAFVGLERAGRDSRFSHQVNLLKDKTAQIRVRGSLVLLLGIAALSQSLGLSPIIGTFLAGVMLRATFAEQVNEELYRTKIEALGYGLFIPAFFITSGLTFELRKLVTSPSALALVPVFFAALLLVRGLPALLYRSEYGIPRARALGLLQATSISFIVPAADLGVQLHKFTPAVGAALIAAGLLSVILCPSGAIAFIGHAAEAVPVPAAD